MTLATIFAIATALYSAVWMYYVRHGPSTVFGAYPDYSPSTRSLQILSVDGDSSAERAGLQPGDGSSRSMGTASIRWFPTTTRYREDCPAMC
jgi:hypothetical protein